MTVFAVIATSPNAPLEAAIARVYPDDNYRLNDLSWLVHDSGSAVDVSQKLGVEKGGIRGTVVLPTGGAYFGVASARIWEWLKLKWEGADER